HESGAHEVRINRWTNHTSMYVRSWAYAARNPLPRPGSSNRNALGWSDASPESLVPSWGRSTLFPWLRGDATWPRRALVPEEDSNDSREVDARGWPCLALWLEFQRP